MTYIVKFIYFSFSVFVCLHQIVAFCCYCDHFGNDYHHGNASAIDCFKCVSIGGNNKECDDPFHNNGTIGYLESPCLSGRKGRDGLFPATSCVKLAGFYYDTGVSLTVRTCALDSGTLTTDSELVRMSHCGGFYFDDKYVRGCVQSCNDVDACNSSFSITGRHLTYYLTVLILQLFSLLYC